MARTENIILRVDQDEKEAIEVRAQILGLGTSEYLREVGLNPSSALPMKFEESQPPDPLTPQQKRLLELKQKSKPIGVLEAHERAGKAIINSGKKQPTQKDANKLAMRLLADGKAKTMKEARDKAAKKLGLDGS